MKIEISNLTKEYIKTRLVLKNISLNIDKGEKITVMGADGAGKTTLFRLMTTLDPKFVGDIFLDGESVKVLSQKELNAVYLTSHFFLYLGRTVEENISYGLKIRRNQRTAVEKKVRGIVLKFGFDKFDGLRVKELSMVDRFKVAVLRGVVRDPEMMIFDDCFKEMNDDERIESIEFLKSTLEELPATVIYGVSSIEDGKLFNLRTVVLNEGEISFDGAFAESQYNF